MATSSIHRGWKLRKHNGILAGVYDGAQNATTVLASNTALDGVLVGTPVTPALAVDSLVLSNTVTSGDLLLAASNGGNSQAWLWVDASAATMTLFASGVEQLRTAVGALVVNEPSADVDFRVESNNMQYAIYSDGGKDSIVLGSNTDTSSADQLVNITRAARTATANTSYYDLSINPAGAVTVPAGTAALVASLRVTEPNITATGTVTAASTVYVADAPTEASSNYALWVDAGATRLDGNLDMSDSGLDILVKANTATTLEISDGTTKLLAFDSRNTVSGVNAITLTPQAITLPNGAASTMTGVKIAAATHVLAGQTQITTEMDGVGLHVAGPTINQSGGAVTVDAAQTVYIADAPTAGTSVTITNLYALRVDAGVSRLDGGVILGDTTANALVSQATSGSGTVTHYIGNQTITTSSDSRVKTDIQEWQGSALDLLRKAEPLKEFQYNLPGGGPQDSGYGPNARGKYLGFMAQETRKWAPWVVNAGAGAECPRCEAGQRCEDHSPWTVEYQHLVPLMIQGLKEIDSRLARLGV